MALVIVLPIALILLAFAALLMFVQGRRLQAQRLTCLPSFHPSVALRSGACAADAADYSFCSDVFLFLVPARPRRWWRVEADGVRLVRSFIFFLCLAAAVVFPIRLRVDARV